MNEFPNIKVVSILDKLGNVRILVGVIPEIITDQTESILINFINLLGIFQNLEHY